MLASIFGGDQQYSQECHSKMGMSLLVKSQLLLEQSQLFIEILIIVSIFIILGALKISFVDEASRFKTRKSVVRT